MNKRRYSYKWLILVAALMDLSLFFESSMKQWYFKRILLYSVKSKFNLEQRLMAVSSHGESVLVRFDFRKKKMGGADEGQTGQLAYKIKNSKKLHWNNIFLDAIGKNHDKILLIRFRINWSIEIIKLLNLGF
jgi:hypothetical protein